ncbi:MAG: DUF1816 domain-containing protein [Leptolyngbyaceae bacterium]|nr:DUF1816 domain-containing protein [Leptolyngbyaceae bacterium]
MKEQDIATDLTTDWWIEIVTTEPSCTYYFGPFQNLTEAETDYLNYVADLEGEGAQGLEVTIKSCNPDILTTLDEET